MTIDKKKLAGIKATPEILGLLDKALKVVPLNSTTECILDESNRTNDETDIIEKALAPISTESAVQTIQAFHKIQLETTDDKSDLCIPINVLRCIATLLDNNVDIKQLIQNSGGLVFTSSASSGNNDTDQSNLSKDEIKFRQRMDRLRLKYEESKYTKLTNNLGMKQEVDDVTTKSMTYAASIGLNMIIAPLAFGCFMYFFAGGLLDYFWKKEQDPRMQHNPTDIRKVIAGVVSGVVMLFIEMILFVIRTHEMDRVMLMKNRKKGSVKPFGPYSSKTSKTFKANEISGKLE